MILGVLQRLRFYYRNDARIHCQRGYIFPKSITNKGQLAGFLG